MEVKAVFFDMDEVLIFSREMWYGLFLEAVEHFKVEGFTREVFEDLWLKGMTDEDIAPVFAPNDDEAVRLYVMEKLKDHIGGMKIEPEARMVFEALHTAGLRTVVIANSPSESIYGILTYMGLHPHMIIGHNEVENPKPAPDMLNLALERFKITPDEAIMVGDHEIDAQAASAAGVRFVGYGREGDLTINTLGELLPHLGLSAPQAP